MRECDEYKEYVSEFPTVKEVYDGFTHGAVWCVQNDRERLISIMVQ